MGIKFGEAKKFLESQQVRIGIAYFLKTELKEEKDFVVEFKGLLKDFKTEERYEEEKAKWDESCLDKFEEYVDLESKDVEIILRMPSLDEVLAIADEDKQLPKKLVLDLKDEVVLKTVLDFLDKDKRNSKEMLKKGMALIEQCYMGSTFEPDEKGKVIPVAEVMKLLKSNKQISQHVVTRFFKLAMGK